MSAPIELKAEKRSALGSRANQRLRKTGIIPAVVYGHKEETLPVQLNKKELSAHIGHGSHLFSLSFDGHSESVLVKDVQYDAFGQEVLHVDFARVDLNERVTVSVGITLKGDPKGEKDGGVLQQVLNELEIECVVTEIPDVINIDVSELGKDESIHVSDIKLGGSIIIITEASLLVAKVEEIAEQIDEVDAEGAAEPEVIGAKKDDDEAAAEVKK